MCEAGLPSQLENDLESADEADQPSIGANWALHQVKDLLSKGAPGYHLYALNKSQSTLRILEGLKED
jgi:methylenetetrahydrofolate reductase (NADPH)